MSLNDPRWGQQGGGDRGRDPKQGPPDLDELWRDFNRRLSGMFRGRAGGGGGDSPRPPLSPRAFGGGIGALIVVVLAVWLMSGFYVVDASQRGVVLRFGRFHAVTEPGLNWRWPYPIESYELVNFTGVRTVEIGYRQSERNKVLKEALMLTDDENIINIQFAVQYVLTDPQLFLFKNRKPEDAVGQVAETAVREIVGKSRMDFVLYEGREQIAANAAKLMQGILDRYETGIQISKVTMQNAQPPEQVQAAFDDAVKAGQDRERQKNEGQAYANDVIPRARGDASRLMQESEGYRARMIATAEGDASRFKQVLTEYNKAPDVTRTRIYIDTITTMLSNTSKIMLDAKGSGNLLYLPLDKLLQAGGSQHGSSQSMPGDAPPVRIAPSDTSSGPPKADVPSTTDFRSRESLRSRDRGER
ncbi:MAG: FtsH protease activity modulator HflK [Rhodocyclaceae bacterium]|nr:FtsH protease activity modulator HflK [Rhodocyclaceae bacterium]MBX3669102.1 FtsH protease activity modulator HflK [Rhodocyclaceae bacterium]